MRTYDFLSRVSVARKKYAFKFFLIVFPLLALAIAELVVMSSVSKDSNAFPGSIVVISFLVLIIAFGGISFYFFNRLLSPIRLVNKSLEDYLSSGKVPELPEEYEDEVGQLMADIQKTIARLDKLITEKSDMVDLLSHDVRSPVGRILSLSNLIKIDDESEKDAYADYIANECTGLLSMLENILLILKEDNHVFRLELVNLDKLIHETLGFFSFAAAEKNLQIKVSVDSNISIPLQQQLFKQAIRNIIGNAIKFSPDGKSIEIEGTQNKEQITLVIRDQGLGFRPNDMKKIFERFTTAGKKGTHGEASTGLGLYLSKKIIEKHGGNLTAESEGENKGAVFTIFLYRLITKKPQDKAIKGAPRQSVVAFHQR